MGQKQKQPQQDLFFEMTRMMVPRDFLEYFSVFEVKELKSEWQNSTTRKRRDNSREAERARGYSLRWLLQSHAYTEPLLLFKASLLGNEASKVETSWF